MVLCDKKSTLLFIVYLYSMIYNNKVKKGEFRYTLYSEDILQFNKVLEDGNTVVVYEGIELFNTYDPFIKVFSDKIDSGDFRSYVNPNKVSGVTSKLIKVINGLLLINQDIDDIGLTKMAGFVKGNYVNGSSVDFKSIFELCKEISETDVESFLRENYPNDFVYKNVFYSSKNSYSASEKSSITRKEIMFIMRRDRRKLIDKGVNFLQGMDSLTKITNKRISSITGFKSDTLRRTLSVRQKRRIRSLNLDRYFSQEKVTQKFYVFLNNYEDMKGKSMSKLSKELKVSKDYVRVFIDIIEENSK